MKVKKLHENATIPTYGTDGAAGMDLYALEQVGIIGGASAKIRTGIAVEIPECHFGGIYPRSGIASKRGLRLANCVGVVDEDYRGEVIVVLHNDSHEYQVINAGDRIAQLVIQPYLKVDVEIADELDDTERGVGGFGSTGV